MMWKVVKCVCKECGHSFVSVSPKITKIKELHSGKLCGKNADIMIIDDPIAKGGTK